MLIRLNRAEIELELCPSAHVMSVVALLEATPHPTREEARAALVGYLCRCGAYDYYLNEFMRPTGEA